MLMVWKILRELLLLSQYWKAEEVGFWWQWHRHHHHHRYQQQQQSTREINFISKKQRQASSTFSWISLSLSRHLGVCSLWIWGTSSHFILPGKGLTDPLKGLSLKLISDLVKVIIKINYYNSWPRKPAPERCPKLWLSSCLIGLVLPRPNIFTSH